MDLLPLDWEYVEQRAGSFIGREWVFAQVRNFLSGPPGIFLLRGDPGTGKTAVAARLAQASSGRVADGFAARPAVAEGTISAAVFCRAGKMTVPELVQRLSRQLEMTVSGFSDALQSTLAPEIKVRDIHVEARDIDGDVTGVRIVLNGLSDERAFSAGLAIPLRQLRERGSAQQIVLLVDAVDEAAAAGEINTFSRYLGKLDGIHLIVTSRPDARVLVDFRTADLKVDLLSNAPPGDPDIQQYIRNRLRGQSSAGATDALVDRIAKEAAGNFLYAFYVTGTLIESDSLGGIDDKAARSLPLPTGGLPGVYEDFLDRQIGGDEAKWADDLRPVLAPLCLALGDGFTAVELGAIASRLTGREFSPTKAGDVIRHAGQFLDGPRPNGPFRVYHQSFSRFLTDPEQNPNWPIDLTETGTAIVRAMMPDGQLGNRDWTAASSYARRHLAAHAAFAGVLDDLLLDPGYLLAAHPPGLLAVLNEARSQAARRASVAYRRVAHRLFRPSDPARDSYLRLAALQTGAGELLTPYDPDIGESSEGSDWRPAWASWRPATPTRVVGELPSAAAVLAAVGTERGTLALAGGEFGLEAWDIDSGQRSATHPWKVLTMAVGRVGEQPVVLAGHPDGIVTVHELPSLQVTASNESAHTGSVLAAVTLNEGSMGATGDSEGALVLWQLPALEAISTRPNAHTIVRALAATALGDGQLLISAGDTLEQNGQRNRETQPVRAWTVPALSLVSNIETTVDLCSLVEAASTPQGCIVVYQKGFAVEVQLITVDRTVQSIGTVETYTQDLLVIKDGDEPQILVCGSTVAPLLISMRPRRSLTLGPTVETKDTARWAGPVDLDGRPSLVSATNILRVWDLEELLAAPSRQGDPSQSAAQHQVEGLTAAGDVLAALTKDLSVRRWRWHSAEELEPLAVRAEQIKTLAACALGGRPHVVVAYSDGIVEAFDAESGEFWPARVDVAAPLQTMAVGLHKGRTVAATAVQLGLRPDGVWREGHPFYGVRLWDLTTGAEIPTHRPHSAQVPASTLAWKLTVAGYTDEKVQHIAGVETADDLLIAAHCSRNLRVWPLNRIDAGFDLREGRDKSISALAGQRGVLAIGDLNGKLEMWRMEERADRRFTREHQGLAALVFGSWQSAPALFSGGRDGWLRVWSQNGTQILSIDIGEGITSLAFLPEDGIAVGTSRGVLIVRLAGAGIQKVQKPFEAKVGHLRTAVQQQDSFHWNWKDWFNGILPPTAPEAYTGPTREIVELILKFPSKTFRALSRWLDDDTPLVSIKECTVADVACALMVAYSGAAFDDLCDALAEADDGTGSESKIPHLLGQIVTRTPIAGAAVCERWSAKSAKHAQLASLCARWILTENPQPDVRKRLLTVETRILSADPTPLARTEALHTLAFCPETRGLVIDELLDRFLGRADGFVSTGILSVALGTHFDLVFKAFEQKLIRDPGSYDRGDLSALAGYVPKTVEEAERILSLFERLWNAAPGEPASEIVSSLMRFAEHPSSSRDRAVNLAIEIASSTGPPGRENLASKVLTGSYTSDQRWHILGAIIGSADADMKRALIKALATYYDYLDETFFEPILLAASDELEANDMVLVRAAQRSKAFASALDQVIRPTTPQTGGLLATFAEHVGFHADPQTAARQAFKVYIEKHRQS